MKRKTIVEIITILFLVFFIHNVINNYVGLQSLKNLLGFYTRNFIIVAWTIIVIETINVVLLIVPGTRTLGLLMTSLLMLALAITVWITPYFPHDFGGILNDRTGPQIIFFAIFGVILALVGALLNPKIIKKSNRQEKAPVIYT
jgi:uncharacterized membrane protein